MELRPHERKHSAAVWPERQSSQVINYLLSSAVWLMSFYLVSRAAVLYTGIPRKQLQQMMFSVCRYYVVRSVSWECGVHGGNGIVGGGGRA